MEISFPFVCDRLVRICGNTRVVVVDPGQQQ